MFFEQSLEHHVADREEGQRLDDGDAPVAVDAVVVDASSRKRVMMPALPKSMIIDSD